jgi:hypothetical protein
MEEEAEVEDELLPAMADDDYSAQLSWQSQSKDNLKCVPISVLFLTDRLRSVLNMTLIGFSWTTLRRISTSVLRHIAAMPSRSRLFARYDTTSCTNPLNAHVRTRRLGR